jgi:uncharacterized Zn-finger protein
MYKRVRRDFHPLLHENWDNNPERRFPLTEESASGFLGRRVTPEESQDHLVIDSTLPSGGESKQRRICLSWDDDCTVPEASDALMELASEDGLKSSSLRQNGPRRRPLES